MILIGLGSNMAGPWGTPRETVVQALESLDIAPVRLVKASSLIETTPFGVVDQPPFVNAVARVETELPPAELLVHLRQLEQQAGRERHKRWDARTLDLDILSFNDVQIEPDKTQSTDAELVLPHPAIAEREFVLVPIAEIAPDWQHPVSGKTAQQMLDELDTDQGGTVIRS